LPGGGTYTLGDAVLLTRLGGTTWVEDAFYWGVPAGDDGMGTPYYLANGHDQVTFEATVCVDGVATPVCFQLTLPAKALDAEVSCS
jgi:hypothetical protein